MTELEVEQLGSDGWFVREGFAGAAEVAAVAARRATEGLFAPAAISRAHHRDEAVRNDSLLWVDPDDTQLAGLFATFEALRVELNQSAWLGLTRFDLQLAHYAPGGHYARHLDALKGHSNRRVTAIAYLNPTWKSADGGQLRLFCSPPVELDPQLGRLVIFLSEKLEHEVLPSAAHRFAATAWYYGR